MLQIGALLASHLLHPQHNGGQGETTKEIHDLPPLVVLQRQPVDALQKIASHAGHFRARTSRRYLPKVRDWVYRTIHTRTFEETEGARGGHQSATDRGLREGMIMVGGAARQSPSPSGQPDESDEAENRPRTFEQDETILSPSHGCDEESGCTGEIEKLVLPCFRASLPSWLPE